MANPEDGTSCTLHCYAPPYSTCKVFCRETGKARVAPVMYHTIRGEKTQHY